MNKHFKLSLLCAAVLMATTGCSEDEKIIYGPNPEMNAQIEQLEADKQALIQANAELEAEIKDLEENPSVKPYDQQSLCASVGIDYEYVDPNIAYVKPATIEAQQVRSFLDARATDCLACHNYEDGVGVILPDSHPSSDKTCSTCHNPPKNDTHIEYYPDGFDTLPEGDPNNPTFSQPVFGNQTNEDGTKGDAVNGITGASGSTYYTTGSYLSADWLAHQVSEKITNYRWVEVSDAARADAETTASTIEQSCALPDIEHMKDMFPNDGKTYMIEAKGNNNGAQIVSTVNHNADGSVTPNIAIFGYSVYKEGNDYYASMSIGKNNTCYNIIENGEARLTYYEYDPSEFEKTGLETTSRNRGARLIVETDYEKSALKQADWTTDVAGFGAGETFTPEQVTDDVWASVGACSLKLKVKNIIPLG